jgi:hypothetical protein
VQCLVQPPLHITSCSNGQITVGWRFAHYNQQQFAP